MGNKLEQNVLIPGHFNNYLIAGNLTNAFAVGEIGSLDDFYIVGNEPNGESPFPLLSGNILDSEGSVLFRLIRNVIVYNPNNCSKIIGDEIGYEIRDSLNELILKVETVFGAHGKLDEECYLTTIKANFYNKEGELVFLANSGEPDEKIETSAKSLFGFSKINGAIGFNQNYKEEELEFLKYILFTNAKVNQLIQDEISDTDFYLEGKFLMNTKLEGCRIFITSGNFCIYKKNSIKNCTFLFDGEAKIIKDLIELNKER